MTKPPTRVAAPLVAIAIVLAAGCSGQGSGPTPSPVAHRSSSRASAGPVAPAAVTWAQIGVTDSGLNQAGLYRTADNNLHVVWPQLLASGKRSYRWATFSPAGRPAGSGTVLSGWETLEGDPQLLADRDGMRLVFIGGQDTSNTNFYSVGAVYTTTSSDGTSWNLVHGSMAAHTVLNDGLAAASYLGSPVVAFGLNNVLYMHAGVDSHAPAAKADQVAATGPVATGLAGAALAHDGSGHLWLAWSDRGYWVRQVLPSAAQPVKVPGSGSGTPDNSPRGKVALAAAGTGVYVAYFTVSPDGQSTAINLWRVGSPSAVPVPGSSGRGGLAPVALAAAPGGRLWLAWFDGTANMIRAAELDGTGQLIGLPRQIPLPPGTVVLSHLQAEASAGPLDLVANITTSASGNQFWLAQIPALAPVD